MMRSTISTFTQILKHSLALDDDYFAELESEPEPEPERKNKDESQWISAVQTSRNAVEVTFSFPPGVAASRDDWVGLFSVVSNKCTSQSLLHGQTSGTITFFPEIGEYQAKLFLKHPRSPYRVLTSKPFFVNRFVTRIIQTDNSSPSDVSFEELLSPPKEQTIDIDIAQNQTISSTSSSSETHNFSPPSQSPSSSTADSYKSTDKKNEESENSENDKETPIAAAIVNSKETSSVQIEKDITDLSTLISSIQLSSETDELTKPEDSEGFIKVGIDYEKAQILVTYKYPEFFKLFPKDWIGLFCHYRELSFESYKYLSSTSGTIAFPFPPHDGYYDMRLFHRGSKPEKEKKTELLISEPFLIGSPVNINVTTADNKTLQIHYQFAETSSVMRTDGIGVYQINDRSNRMTRFPRFCVTTLPSQLTGECVLQLPPLPSGLYEVRYFKGNATHTYSGKSNSFEITTKDTLQIQFVSRDWFEVKWCIESHPISSWDWIGVFDVLSGKMYAYKYIIPKEPGGNFGFLSFEVPQMEREVRVSLFSSDDKINPLISKTYCQIYPKVTD